MKLCKLSVYRNKSAWLLFVAFWIFPTIWSNPITDSLNTDDYFNEIDNEPKFYPELSFDYGFDFESLNPYRYPVENLKDTLLLVISDTSHCGFEFPHPGKVNSTFGWRKGRVHSGI